MQRVGFHATIALLDAPDPGHSDVSRRHLHDHRGAMFPAVIIVAVVVKLIEVARPAGGPRPPARLPTPSSRRSRTSRATPATTSPIPKSSTSRSWSTEYTVNGRKLRGNRITIGEKISGFEIESTLARYTVGATVTVYYDPANPKNAVLERDLPKIVFAGVGCLLLFFIGGPLVAAAMYFHGVDWLKAHIANPIAHRSWRRRPDLLAHAPIRDRVHWRQFGGHPLADRSRAASRHGCRGVS